MPGAHLPRQAFGLSRKLTAAALPPLARGLRPLEGMSEQTTNTLPHHKLVAFQVAVQLLRSVQAAAIRDRTLREQALRAAKSACLNTAEGAGRISRADKARAFVIARGEATEAVAAVEIAAITREADVSEAQRCVALGGRLVALLSGLAR